MSLNYIWELVAELAGTDESFVPPPLAQAELSFAATLINLADETIQEVWSPDEINQTLSSCCNNLLEDSGSDSLVYTFGIAAESGNVYEFTFEATESVNQRVVPAPGTVALLGLGLAGLAWRRKGVRHV